MLALPIQKLCNFNFDFKNIFCTVEINRIYNINNVFLSNVLLGIKDDNNTITDETIRKLFEKLKEVIGHDLGFKEQKISTNSSAMYNLSVKGNLTDVHITDPSSYIIPLAQANMTDLTFETEIKYEELNVKGNYGVDAESGFFSVIGKGQFSGKVKDLTIGIACKFNLTKDNTLQMEYFDFNYIVPNITMHFDNFGSDKDVTEALNMLINIGLPAFINVTKSDVLKFVNQNVQKYSVFLFTGMTVDEFVSYIHDIINM